MADSRRQDMSAVDTPNQLSNVQNRYGANAVGGCLFAPPGEYDWTVHVRRRCGLLSNYFNHFLLLGPITVLHTYYV